MVCLFMCCTDTQTGSLEDVEFGMMIDPTVIGPQVRYTFQPYFQPEASEYYGQRHFLNPLGWFAWVRQRFFRVRM
ncbi:hypothetical protein L596_000334 [Steinernema carpocapsae]|uniref:Uncharacterized protein n=1 Tax=Steinernema carpocapsae TaxID=34508 RepID=A0A4U8UI18_STECR|nr:hypothetical protein L596_000334 [Steinernema carpocapsae]